MNQPLFSLLRLRIFGSLVSGLLLASLAGCNSLPPVPGSGTITSETRALPEFREARLAGSAQVEYRHGQSSECTITADDNLLELIDTEVRDGILRIEFQQQVQPTQRIQIVITSPERQGFAIAGSADLTAEGLDADRFRLSIAGSGKAQLSGQVEDLRVDISGSGSVQSPQLICDQVTIKIAGSGKADVHAQQQLSLTIAGSGRVTYSGDAEVSQNVVGSGKVEQVTRTKSQ
jgi:hypothetical protein